MRQSLALLLALCAQRSCAAPVRELIDAVANADDLDDFQHPLPGLRHELSDLEPFNDDVAEIMYLSDADAPSGDDDDAQEPNVAEMNAAHKEKDPKELSIDDKWFDDDWEPSEDDVADDDWRVAEPMPSNRNAKLLSIAEELIDVVADAVAREPKDPDVRVENTLGCWDASTKKWFRCWTDNLYLMPLVARPSEAAPEYKDLDIDDAWFQWHSVSYDDNVQDPDDTFMYYGIDNPKDTDIFY